MKNINSLQEQIERMKSLMGEERLYGNLVDKIITEQKWLKDLFVPKIKINWASVIRGYKSALKSALELSGNARRVALSKISLDIKNGKYNSDLVKYFKNLGYSGKYLDELVYSYNIGQRMLLKAVATGDNYSALAKRVGIPEQDRKSVV